VLSILVQLAVGDRIIPNDPTRDKTLILPKVVKEMPIPNPQEYKEYLKAWTGLSQP
jgi:hypothetical protein